jgi:hypothetical protein
MGNRFASSIVTSRHCRRHLPGACHFSDCHTHLCSVSFHSSLKTPWGNPSAGIWTDEFDTPFQRSSRNANTGVSSPSSNALTWTRARAANPHPVRELSVRSMAPTTAATFFSTKRTGARTSKIVDPPNGRFPPLTPAAQKRFAADGVSSRAGTIDRHLQEQAAGLCRRDIRSDAIAADAPRLRPRYNTARMNRNDGPEDSALVGALPHRWTA